MSAIGGRSVPLGTVAGRAGKTPACPRMCPVCMALYGWSKFTAPDGKSRQRNERRRATARRKR